MSNNPYYNNFESGGYFCNALNRDITMVRGDTMSFGFEVQGLGGELPTAVIFTAKDGIESSSPLFTLDLTNTITIRDYDSETDVYTFALRLPPEKTYDLNLGRYFYDLEIQVNNDVFTILRGRLELVADITRERTSPTPQHESGDDIAYPIENIPLGSVKLYTEQTISDIADEIQTITGDDTQLIPVEMVNALGGIKTELDNISDTINTMSGTTGDIPLDEMSERIQDIESVTTLNFDSVVTSGWGGANQEKEMLTLTAQRDTTLTFNDTATGITNCGGGEGYIEIRINNAPYWRRSLPQNTSQTFDGIPALTLDNGDVCKLVFGFTGSHSNINMNFIGGAVEIKGGVQINGIERTGTVYTNII